MNDPAQAERLAALHATAFDAPWDAAAFADLLERPGVFAVEAPDGFILMRAVADEAEVLTLAVRPQARGQGLGGRLTVLGVAGAGAMGAGKILLEVAEDNAPARAVYSRLGFAEAGRRPRYYGRPDGSRADALLLVLNVPATLP